MDTESDATAESTPSRAPDGCVPGVRGKVVFIVLLVILMAPSGFFLGASYFQLERILKQVAAAPETETSPLIANSAKTPSETLETLATLALEHDVMMLRHQRAGVMLATRTWMRFMSLMFGAILIVIGGAFILGRITVPAGQGEVNESGLVRVYHFRCS